MLKVKTQKLMDTLPMLKGVVLEQTEQLLMLKDFFQKPVEIIHMLRAILLLLRVLLHMPQEKILKL